MKTILFICVTLCILKVFQSQNVVNMATFPPLINCTNSQVYQLSSLESITNENSYMHEFISNILTIMNYSQLSLTINCITYDNLQTTISNNDVLFFAYPLPMTIENSQYGQYSIPYFSSSIIQISSPNSKSLQGIKYLLQGFTYDLWIFLCGMIIVIAHLIWFFEKSEDNKFPIGYKEGITEALYHTILYFFMMSKKTIRSLPGRIVIGSYVIISYFITAYLFAIFMGRLTYLQGSPLDTEIQQISQYTKFGSFDDMYSIVSNLRPNVIYVNYTRNEESLNRMFDDLNNGNIDYVILDKMTTSMDIISSCQSSQLFLVNYALSFPIDTPESYIEQVNNAIISMKQNGILTKLEMKYFNLFRENNCYDNLIDNYMILTIWIILIIGIGISLIWFIVINIRKKSNKYKIQIKKSKDTVIIEGMSNTRTEIKKGIKNILKENSQKSKEMLIKYLDEILMKYASKHKDSLISLRNMLITKEDLKADLYLVVRHLCSKSMEAVKSRKDI